MTTATLSGSVLNPVGVIDVVDLRITPLDSRLNLLKHLSVSQSISGSYSMNISEGYYSFEYLNGAKWVNLGNGYISGSQILSIQDVLNLEQISKSPVGLNQLSDIQITDAVDGEILLYSDGVWVNSPSTISASSATSSYAYTASYVGNSTYFVDPDDVSFAINVAGKIQGERFVDSLNKVLLGTDLVGGESGLVGDGDDYIAVKINSTGQYLYGNSYLEVDGTTGDITGSHYIKAVKGFVGDLTGSVQGTASVALTSSYVGDGVNYITPTGIRISGSTQLGDGGISNYISINERGHITFTGSAKPWDDIRIEPVARNTGTNAPSFEKFFDNGVGSRGCYLYSFDDAAVASEKEIFFSLQMPHTWDGTSIGPHVHWIGNVNDSNASPRWGLEYTWANIGSTYSTSSIIYTSGVNIVPDGTDAHITASRHYISSFGNLAPTTNQNGISSVLVGRLFRNSSDAADTYNASSNKCGLLYIDFHYQLARLGSDEEYTA